MTIERPQDETPKDRKFHENRWAFEARTWGFFKKANKGTIGNVERDRKDKLFKKWGLKPDDVKPEDVMYAEALLDNEHFDLRQSPEYKAWQERLQDVVKDFKAVRDNTPDRPKEFKLVNIKLGTGTMSGYCTGQDMAMADLGYDKLIDVTIGSSGASGPALYSIAGQSRNGASMFMNEVASPEFLSHGGVQERVALDTEVIARGMERGPKAVDQEAVGKSKKEVYAVAVNKKTGKAELIDFKSLDNMIDGCRASSAIPFFRRAVEINGNQYYDGAFKQFPFEEILERFKPTHILVQPNVPFRLLRNLKYKAAEQFGLWLLSTLKGNKNASLDTEVASLGPLNSVRHFVESVDEYLRMKENAKSLFEKLEKTYNVKIAVLWPPEEDLASLVNDAHTMKRAILSSYRDTVTAFGEQQPKTIKLFAGDIIELEEPERRRQAA